MLKEGIDILLGSPTGYRWLTCEVACRDGPAAGTAPSCQWPAKSSRTLAPELTPPHPPAAHLIRSTVCRLDPAGIVATGRPTRTTPG
jgi:hypothetical protein